MSICGKNYKDIYRLCIFSILTNFKISGNTQYYAVLSNKNLYLFAMTLKIQISVWIGINNLLNAQRIKINNFLESLLKILAKNFLEDLALLKS